MSNKPIPRSTVSSSPSSSSQPIQVNKSAYCQNYFSKIDESILTEIEPIFYNKSYPKLIQIFFHPNLFHFSETPFKTRKFYKKILIETDSIEPPKWSPDNVPEEQVNYHKIKFKRILKPTEWPVSGYRTQVQFKTPFKPSVYTYYDYIKTVGAILYFKPFSHS